MAPEGKGAAVNTSEKIDQVAPSIYAVHRDLKNPVKNARADVRSKGGASYSYEYLSLPALIDHAKAALKDASLAVVQEVESLAGGVAVRTIFLHISGQWISLGPTFVPAANDAQGYGSAITYARRYALAAALGLAADEDDDATSATSSPAARSQGVPSGRDGDAGERGAGVAEGTGEGPEATPASTPSGQPAGHHDHKWEPSPTMPGWRWCTVKGCGKAEKIKEEARA